MQKLNDLSRYLTPLEPDSTLIAVIEMSLSSWLVAGIVPGVERQPLKKLAVDEGVLLKLLHRWREEAKKAGYMIKRIAVAFEAGRDGFWPATHRPAAVDCRVLLPLNARRKEAPGRPCSVRRTCPCQTRCWQGLFISSSCALSRR